MLENVSPLSLSSSPLPVPSGPLVIQLPAPTPLHPRCVSIPWTLCHPDLLSGDPWQHQDDPEEPPSGKPRIPFGGTPRPWSFRHEGFLRLCLAFFSSYTLQPTPSLSFLIKEMGIITVPIPRG